MNSSKTSNINYNSLLLKFLISHDVFLAGGFELSSRAMNKNGIEKTSSFTFVRRL